MDFYKLFYWFAVGDKLSNLFVWSAGLSTAAFLISQGVLIFCAEDSQTPYYKAVRNLSRFTYLVMPLSWFLYVATPNKKEAALILAGGYVGNFLTQDTSAKQLPHDIVQFLRVQLKDAAKEAKESINGPTKPEDMTKEELLELYRKTQIK